MDEIFRKAAKSALFAWKHDDSGLDDLVNDLWVWYLERPSVQKKLESCDKILAIDLARTHSLKILSGQALQSDKFNGRNLYSSDSVKEALLGKFSNRYLADMLPSALRALEEQNSGYAEAIKLRYEDCVIPKRQSKEQVYLSRAVKSLTEHVNVIATTAGVDADGNVSEGPGSRHAVFPETRKPQGWGHSDPTGNTAILLIEHPELRDEYLHEEPLPQFLGGRWYAQPA